LTRDPQDCGATLAATGVSDGHSQRSAFMTANGCIPRLTDSVAGGGEEVPMPAKVVYRQIETTCANAISTLVALR
jgi:hypothetical protein